MNLDTVNDSPAIAASEFRCYVQENTYTTTYSLTVRSGCAVPGQTHTYFVHTECEPSPSNVGLILDAAARTVTVCIAQYNAVVAAVNVYEGVIEPKVRTSAGCHILSDFCCRCECVARGSLGQPTCS